MSNPEKAELKSMDVAEDKKRLLEQLFPEAITESLSEDGKLVRAVDFGKLKAVLGTFSEVLEGQKERYGMTWPGKNECLKIIQQPSIATLKPCREESVNFDETENLFIEGDNLEVLKLLQKAYYGKVKMIYIDPPYNTGNDFIYPDDFTESLGTYLAYTGQCDLEGRKFKTNTEDSGRYHSNWLNMMYRRLKLAQNLLSEDGAILVSINDRELPNLLLLMNEIFGEENQTCIFTWKSRAKPTNAGDAKYRPQKVAEYVVAYGKKPADEALLNVISAKCRTYPHEDGGGKYRTTTILTSNRGTFRRETMRFEAGGYQPDDNYRWKAGKAVIDDLFARNRILFNDDGLPMEKKYEEDESDPLYPVYCFMDPDLTGTAEIGKQDLNEAVGNHHGLDTVKPVQLLRYFIETFTSSNDIAMDFFAGSCTSAHAVIELNRDKGTSRRFIMVQLPEPCDPQSEAYRAGFKTIAEIGKRRIRQVIKKLNDEDAGELDLKGDKKPDRGFRAFKLDRSNFKVWDSEQAAKDPAALAKQLELHEQHILKGTSPEDILYELLLKAGFPLTTKVEKREMAGKEIFSIEDGALLICLERELTKELIRAMADASPSQVICLDEGFKGNDQLKANAVQTFKAHAQGKGKEAGIVFRTV